MRYWDTRNPQSKLDLRQELLNTDLDNKEWDTWLGKNEENDELLITSRRDRFVHDILLKRSLSLDGGIDIIDYLQTISSDWSGSSLASSWTVYSDSPSRIEHYKRFGNVPASQYVMKSRRAFSDIDSAFFARSLALSVLRSSYREIDTGHSSMGSQIKKLREIYSLNDSFDDLVVLNKIEECEQQDTGEIEVTKPFYRRKSSESANNKTSDSDREDNKRYGPRRISIASKLSHQGSNTADDGLKRKVFMKRNSCHFDRCENILRLDYRKSRRWSTECGTESMSRHMYREDSSNDIKTSGNRKLDRAISLQAAVECNRQVVSMVSTTQVGDSSEAKYERLDTNASTLVDLSKKCDCRICLEEESEAKKSLVSRVLNSLFLKIVSSRNLTYSDENNNMNEREMYDCFVHVLKLMLGLWLRHLDHN